MAVVEITDGYYRIDPARMAPCEPTALVLTLLAFPEDGSARSAVCGDLRLRFCALEAWNIAPIWAGSLARWQGSRSAPARSNSDGHCRRLGRSELAAGEA